MKKLVNLRTPLFIGLSLIIGIIFSFSIYLEKVFPAILSAGVFALSITLYIVYSFKESKGKFSLILSFIFILFSLFGGVSFYIKVDNFNKASLGNHISDVSGRVSEINEKDGYKTLILTDVSISYPDEIKSKYKVSIVYFGTEDIEYGDRLNYTAVLNDRTLYYKGKFNVYDIGNNVKYSSTVMDGEYHIIKNKPNPFESVRLFIKNTLKGGLEVEGFSVVYALLTGNSDYIENNTLENFRASGVAHIFAVSGLHIGFLSLVLTFILDKLKVNKMARAFIIVFCLLFYSGICGFSSSSLRATIMCAVMLFAGITGEKYDGLSALGVALTILLIAFPLQLFFVGFQLSFSVVFAILILSKPMEKLFKKLPKKLANALSAVLSAQIVSMPIMIIHFGAFSLISVLANLIFIPAVSVIFILALLSCLFAGLFSSSVILLPLGYVIKAVIFLINALDFTVFMVGGFTLGFSIIFYYLAFIFLSGMINLKKKTVMLLCIIFACVFLVGTFTENFVEYSRCKIYSITSKNLSVSLVSDRKDNVLIVTNARRGGDFDKVISVINDKGIKTLDGVILLSGEKVMDAQEVCSSLQGVVEVEEVFVYGEIDENVLRAMEKSFPEINLNFASNSSIFINDLYFEYLLDGKGVTIERNSKKGLFVGDIEGTEEMRDIKNSTFEFAICVEAEDYLYSLMMIKDKFTYHRSYTFSSAEEVGLLLYYLK